MRSFRHATPAFRVYHGVECLDALPAELDRLQCRRAVVFCGKSLARSAAAMRLVTEALGARHAGTFDGAAAHSPLPAVLAGMDALRALEADAVIALGGGSAVVTARASSILLAEGRDIDALCTRYPAGQAPISPRLARPKLPQLVLATTPTTAYAKAGSAVLDPARGQRLALFDPKTRASALFIHPVLALTAPAELTRSSAVQAFAMAVQGIESKRSDPLADALLVHALRVLSRNLRRLALEPEDAQTRGELMLGALLAGQGSDHAPPGLAAALAHCVGARLHLDNGVTNAVLLPHAMRFNAQATQDRLSLVSDALGARSLADDAVEGAIAATEALFAELGLPRRLRDIGVPRDALEQLSRDAAGDWFLHQNPRRVRDAAELQQVLENAW